MSEIPYSVSVVLDREFGERIYELMKMGPVWAVDSIANRETAQKIWNESPSRDHLNGVTVFDAPTDHAPEQLLIGEMDTIDLHHGVYSADPAYSVLHVAGCGLSPSVQEKLSEFGFDSFIQTPLGFEATRPVPSALGE
jgi:hypothetical protein